MNIEVYSLYNQLNVHTYQNIDVVDIDMDNIFIVIDKDTDKKIKEYPYSEYSWHELTPNEERLYRIYSNSSQTADVVIPPQNRDIVIGNCDKIILAEKGIDIKVEIKVENFDDIEYIVINDYKFKRER